jgi:RNA polymerase sigma-70 factor (sigma-E family)
MTVVDTATAPLAEKGDFEQFYAQGWSGAVRLASLLTQQTRAAEDLAQEAFARMYPKWRDIDAPAAYLRTSIVNACRSWQARERTARVKLPMLDVPVAQELAFDALADAVAALPYRQRAVLVLRYHLDLTEAEIAEALGCRPGTVKSLAARALDALKKGIEQ